MNREEFEGSNSSQKNSTTSKEEKEQESSSSGDEEDNDSSSSDSEGEDLKEREKKELEEELEYNRIHRRSPTVSFAMEESSPVEWEDGNVEYEKTLTIYTLWRNSFLIGSVESLRTPSSLKNDLSLFIPSKWTFLMCSGGHFAGAIFDSTGRCTLHRTFHRYTVRKGQGGAQGTKDNQTGGRIKSAGSSIRRQNEARLKDEIRQLMIEWKDSIDSSSIVFMVTPGNNKKIFMWEDAQCPLRKGDERIRNVPFTTKRPTLSEIDRIRNVLSTVTIQSNVPIHQEKVEEIHVEENVIAPPSKEEEIPPALPDELEIAIEGGDLERVKELFESNYESPIQRDATKTSTPLYVAIKKRLDRSITGKNYRDGEADGEILHYLLHDAKVRNNDRDS